MAKREQPDEMDLSREYDQVLRDEILWCPCCGSTAMLLSIGPVGFPYKVGCAAKACGLQTPWLKLKELAVLLWNRRVDRKPSRLIDKPAADDHTPQRQPRSSGRGLVAGKRVTGRKGAQLKESDKSND